MKRILRVLIIGFILFAATYALAEDAETSPLLGEWFTEGEESVVEIYESDEAYCGKIVWLKEPTYPDGSEKTDSSNPDESMRDRKIVGMDIVWGFQPKRKNTWTAGKIYDPNNGKTYSCNAKLKGDKLSIRGYVGAPLFGRTTVWTRKQ
jgi:uncharacterized protein (DUF2147 family)